MNFIDKAFGIHAQALTFRSQRSGVLAANIANSSTPGYLARDYDFKSALKQVAGGGALRLKATRSSHLQTENGAGDQQLMYRLPNRSAANNTVEAEVEQAAFAENALRYQASLRFLSGSISGLRKAIRGE